MPSAPSASSASSRSASPSAPAPLAAAETFAFFRAAASYLARGDLRCPVHRVAHTGKLARAVVLDLALCDATGDERYWQRAIERARWVAGRLAPDPEHGALIYLPGRLDPRNCSNSVIDSGECTDALARLLLHPRATSLCEADAALLGHAVERNAETYLRTAVVEKGITNQRLWGAMGLASAYGLHRRETWRNALVASLRRAIEDQHGDGSWPYQPDAARERAHTGAADVTVYYHSRCLAFLLHVTGRVPELETDEVRDSLERGLEFLALVTTPDGLKPLALEGKRWFWDGSYEAGSAAYDLYALHRGADRFDRPELRALAQAAWSQLRRHQLPDGSIRACLERSAADFVCPDFHTADLAWTAQVMHELGGSTRPSPRVDRPTTREAPDAGIVRLETPARVALVRTRKQAANTQFGGTVGGGSLAAATTRDGTRLLAPHEARWCTCPPIAPASLPKGLNRFLRDNAPGREGRQWLFVARVLVRAGRPLAALRRVWRGVGQDSWAALRGTVSSAWACDAEPVDGDEVGFRSTLAERSGETPGWARDLRVEHRYESSDAGLRVTERLQGAAPAGTRIAYTLPAAATDVRVTSEGLAVTRRGQRLEGVTSGAPLRVDVTYAL